MAQSLKQTDVRSQLYRGLGWLLILALAAAAVIVFLVAIGLVQPEQLVGHWWLGRQALAPARAAEGNQLVAIAAVAAVVAVLAIALLLAPASRRARSSSLHLLVSDERGFVVVDSQGIARVAELAAVSAQGVLDAEVEIDGGGLAPVRVRVDVGVVPGANLKRAGEEVRDAVGDAIERLVGIGVRDIRTAVHVLEPDQFGRLLE